MMWRSCCRWWIAFLPWPVESADRVVAPIRYKATRPMIRKRIGAVLARRGQAHGSGLGVYRWVVKRTLAWLHQFRRLRLCWERRADIHEALLDIGCILICWNYLKGFC